MKIKFLHCSIVIIVVMLSFLGNSELQAGTKDMTAGKRIKFKDSATDTMREVYVRREAESKEYKEKMLSNSKKSMELLIEIRDLLKRLNEKE